MIHILIGGAGCGKSTKLIQQIKQAAQQQETVITLVPEQFSYEFDRKLYRDLGPETFNLLQTHSFKSLARWIFQRFGSQSGDQTNADELTRYALLYQAILYTSEREHALHILEKQCRQPAFVEELGMLFAQFRRSGIPPERFYDICCSCDGQLQEKTMDLFRIYQQYDHLLYAHHLKDTESDLTEAAAIANGMDAFLGDTLFIDEFESFTEDEYEMLSVLISSCKEIYFALRTEETEPSPFSLFASVNETLSRIRRIAAELHIPVQIETCSTPYRFQSADLQWLSTHAFRKQETFSGKAEHVHILDAVDPTEEADFTCATIRRLLASDPSLRCRDIAVLTNQQNEYHSILETAMERYDLPCHFDEKQSVLYTPLMVYLLTLLELIRLPFPDTELLLRLGKTGLTACMPEEMAILENYCYCWNIDGKTWNTPFIGGEAETAEQLRQKLLAPLRPLKQQFSKSNNGKKFCQLLFSFLEQQQVEEKLNTQLLAIADSQIRMETSEEWAFVWNSWISVLDHMADLYADFVMEPNEFCAVTTALARTIQRAIPPRTLDAVFVSQGNTARLNAPKIVFLLGVCEGTFPSAPGGNGLFSEKDCLTLEQMDFPVLKSRETQLADARLAAYKLLSAASQDLYLLYPHVNITHQKCYPAAILTQITRLFSRTKQLSQSCSDYDSTYYAVTMRAAYFQYIQHYSDHTPGTESIRSLLFSDPFYQKRLFALEKIANAHNDDPDAPLFTISNAKWIEQSLGKTLRLSASGLEQYQLCPFSYFCQRILRLHPRQKMQLAGAGTGSLIHYCLEQLFRCCDRDTFLAMDLAALLAKVQQYASAFWQESMGGDFSKSAREIAVLHHTIHNMEPLLQHLQEELRQSAFYPKYLELPIASESKDFPPLYLHTKQGQTVQLLGKVDRVDLCQKDAHTWVRVIDYKTGSRSFSFGDLLYGLDLQMLIYLFTITAPGTALEHAKPAGVLYLPSGKIRSDQQRTAHVLPQKQYYDTYRMNGILLKDSAVLTAMEADGKGLFLPGTLTPDGTIAEGSGQFLTDTQMKSLRNYVFRTLIQTAERIYSGEIDANPLQLTDHDGCTFCQFSNICGNIDHRHSRCGNGTQRTREKLLLEKLQEIEQEEQGGNL